jgi:hypothetical protein
MSVWWGRMESCGRMASGLGGLVRADFIRPQAASRPRNALRASLQRSAISGQLLDQRREHTLDFHPWPEIVAARKEYEGTVIRDDKWP